MPVQARIGYLLSEQGRRKSLLQGGSGRKSQEVVGFVTDADFDCFTVDDNGNVELDLTRSFHIFDTPLLEFSGRAHWADSQTEYEEEIHWDVVPSWSDLLDIARQLKRAADEDAFRAEKREKEKEEAGEAFLKNPDARATTITKEHVTVGEHQFPRHSSVGINAHKRWQQDQDDLKAANRATLAEWVGQHGTENQRKRMAAGLLPWKEAFDAAEDYLFAPIAPFEPYQKFEVADICMCRSRIDGPTCSPKFQSVDATELTAAEWDTFARIKSAVPGAQFQLREHRAQCESVAEPLVKRGVIVKFALGSLAFRREFALTDDGVPF